MQSACLVHWGQLFTTPLEKIYKIHVIGALLLFLCEMNLKPMLPPFSFLPYYKVLQKVTDHGRFVIASAWPAVLFFSLASAGAFGRLQGRRFRRGVLSGKHAALMMQQPGSARTGWFLSSPPFVFMHPGSYPLLLLFGFLFIFGSPAAAESVSSGSACHLGVIAYKTPPCLRLYILQL
jgi:hypothetical protein